MLKNTNKRKPVVNMNVEWKDNALAEQLINNLQIKTKTVKADIREGKDVAHVKALDKGGSNKAGLFIESAHGNRSFKRDSKGNLVSEKAKGEKGEKKLSKVIKPKK